ncbi:hypothetical protein MMC18_006398, partial [Xylographa bjoerkii]|nr:hypothetical protein [Xylographa bjoerkii]
MTELPVSASFHDVAVSNDSGPNTEKVLERPWKAFWPSKNGSNLDRWLKTDTPEVLSWQFKPHDTFDRPWRAYTRTELAKQEAAYTILPAKNKVIPKTEEEGFDEKFNHEMVKDHATDFPPVLGHDVEEMLRNNNLPTIAVDAFNYLAPLELYRHQKPYLSRLPFIKELKRSNIVGKSYPTVIHNVRGNEHLFTLDKSGFEFIELPFNLHHWTDTSLQQKYIPFLSSWLEDYFECERVFIYAYNFRGNDPNPSDKPWKNPFFLAHCDATEASCKLRMQLHFPDEVDEVLNKRYRFVNIWRSITPPDQDCPLALCDYRTVSSEEYIKTDVIFPHCCDEGYDIQFHPAHRWFYQKGMSTDEIIMFKLDDSADNVAK